MKKLSGQTWSFNTRDLMRATSCDHCTRLAIARELNRPGVVELLDEYKTDPAGLAIEYGKKFETALEQELLAYLGTDAFRRPEVQPGDSFEETIAKTIDLMAESAPVIYQGTLKHTIGNGQFVGMPDFLVRADYDLVFVDGKLQANQVTGRSAVGYIAWDAKLSNHAKPNYMLQVALYIDALEAVGYKAESALHGLILGNRTLAVFEEIEIVPGMQKARSYLLAEFDRLAEGASPSEFDLDGLKLYCETTKNCDLCEYPDLCKLQRVLHDDLVQVSSINTSQIEKLKSVGISTMAALGAATDEMRPTDFSVGTFEKLRRQARLQTLTKTTGKPQYELLDDPEIGVLPPSSTGDVFFDMEGFPYFEQQGGLEYLFGNIIRASKGPEVKGQQFIAFWAHDREQEKQAFIEFVTWLHDRLRADPTAHVYHYASYEVSAMNRLALRHGVMGDEIAWMLDEGKFVDLLKVVKGSMVVGFDSYSIKKVEALYGFEHKGEVASASSSLDFYDEYRTLLPIDGDAATRLLQDISDYNEDDCVSTMQLYDFLAGLPGAHAKYSEHRERVDRKKAEDRRFADDKDDSPESQRAAKAERELNRLIEETANLISAVDDWPWGRDEDADYRARIWLACAHSMLYYNREEVSRWREWRIRKDQTLEALDEDRKALVVEGCLQETLVDQMLGSNASASIRVEYSYRLQPGQTNFLSAGSKIFVRFDTGANQQDTDYGDVLSVDGDLVRFRRQTTVGESLYPPNAIFENGWLPLVDKPKVVGDWVKNATARWGSPENPAPEGNAVIDLLMRRRPRLNGVGLRPAHDGDAYLPAIIDAAERLDHSILAIQGPPGSGKTYLGSRTIKHLVDQGKRIAVVANSHAAVQNLLYACIEAGVDGQSIAKQNQSGDSTPKPWHVPKGNRQLEEWRTAKSQATNGQTANDRIGYVVGGTSWTFSSRFLLTENFDYVFIDEAAQFSLVDAICVGNNAVNMVLLGDPQQLTQVVQAVHPGGVDNSALGHYMGEQQILSEDFGYFIEITRRMHPKVNQPVSWLSYQGKLHSHESASKRTIQSFEPGLAAIEVVHTANTSHSIEEAAEVIEIVRELEIEQEEILVVAPYNAQVDLLREELNAAGFLNVRVGTVDKFQGQEALAVIISLAASSANDAPRGLEFLLDRNRMNVALSRAKTNSFLVYSPALLRTQFNSVIDLTSVSRLLGVLAFAS